MFKIKVNCLDNLIRMIDDMNNGSHAIHDIHTHKYLDTTYEMRYGYDLVLDSVNAKKERKQRLELEQADKKTEKEVLSYLQMCQTNYANETKKILTKDHLIE